jgi:quercetin dioxygenase-like cupin family protein
MATRDADLQAFLDTACAAFDAFAQDSASRRSLARIFAALERPVTANVQVTARLPVCAHLAQAAASENFDHPALRRLANAFAGLEPRLSWRRREARASSASANFAQGHANAMIAGPGGLESRTDVWLGATLLAPHVRYPDHEHPPEETYLVMSDGEFSHGGGPWFRPGVGGTFYNEPGITHAMRSHGEPLLAFWALCAEPSAASG